MKIDFEEAEDGIFRTNFLEYASVYHIVSALP